MSIQREEFKSRLLRNLGDPMTKVNVTPDQIEDVVNDGIRYYHDHHYDGSELVYLFHEITQQDIDRQYIQLPDHVVSVLEIVENNPYRISGDYLFDPIWHIAADATLSATSGDVYSYDIMMQYLSLLDRFFKESYMINFSYISGKLKMEIDWKKLPVGKKIAIQAYRFIDPEEYSKVYSDRWLIRYCTALLKYQWGTNLRKFQGIQLVGGLDIDAVSIMQEAQEEIQALEEKMMDEFTNPVDFFVG